MVPVESRGVAGCQQRSRLRDVQAQPGISVQCKRQLCVGLIRVSPVAKKNVDQIVRGINPEQGSSESGVAKTLPDDKSQVGPESGSRAGLSNTKPCDFLSENPRLVTCQGCATTNSTF